MNDWLLPSVVIILQFNSRLNASVYTDLSAPHEEHSDLSLTVCTILLDLINHYLPDTLKSLQYVYLVPNMSRKNLGLQGY